MWSPGRIYLHANELNNPTAVVENWIANYERTRTIYAFPIRILRNFGYTLIALGCVYLALEIILMSILSVFLRVVFVMGFASGITSILAGAGGVYAAKRCSNAGLLDFLIFTFLLNVMSVFAIILNTFNLDVMCNVDGAETYLGKCDLAVIVLQSLIAFINGVFFIVSTLGLLYICRTFEDNAKLQVPPLVIYCSSLPVEEALKTEEQKASMLEKEHQQEVSTSGVGEGINNPPSQQERRGDIEIE